MGNRLETSIVVPYTDPDETGVDGIQLQMELNPGFTPPDITRVRLYPSVPAAKVVTNLGEVAKEGSQGLQIDKEILQFQGSDTASAELPIIVLNSAESFGGGSIFDRDGNQVSVTFSKENGDLKASEVIYGAVEISYQTSFIMLRYSPEVVPNENLRLFGSILAFFNGSVATFEVPLPELNEGDFTELYRITSESVVNSEGVFEKPEGWTGEPGSPTFPEGEPDGADPNITVKRVHEIGYITPLSSTFKRELFVPTERPKIGTGFKPVKELKINTTVPADVRNEPLVADFIDDANNRL